LTRVPDLKTERLLLRDVLLADPVAYQQNFADYEVIRELAAAVPWPYPENGVAMFLEKLHAAQGKDRWVWAIHLKSIPGEPIGNIDLRRTPENRGFWLARKHWGKGIMTEATDAVTDCAFAALGFEALILSNASGNTRSRRIKEKSGAKLLRTEPATFVDPAYTEREVWQLKKSDWIGRNSRTQSLCH
jgi:RimJ/RimL family protein N-acetyltransferase